MNAPPDTLAIARLYARQQLPYLTHVLMALQPIARPGLGTCATDKFMRLYYDPEWLSRHSREDAAFIIAHEALHNALQHHKRLLQVPKQVRNIACDLAINSALTKAGLPAPPDGVLPEKFGFRNGLSAEEYAALLLQRQPKAEENSGQSGQSDPSDADESDGEGQDAGGDGSDEAGAQEEGKAGQNPSPDGQETEQGTEGAHEGQEGDAQQDGEDSGQGGGQDGGQDDGQGGEGEAADGQASGLEAGQPYEGPPPDRSKGEGGSSADGQPKPWECPAPDPNDPTEANPPGLDEFDQQMVRRMMAQDIERFRGTVPGDLRREVEGILRPKASPVERLRTAVKFAITQRRGYGTFTYRRPSRRQIPGGPILPAHRENVPNVVVVVDTSGSMGKKDIRLALGVIADVCRGFCGPRGLRVLAGDTQCQAVCDVFRPEEVQLKGGGGTDMRQLLRQAAESRPRPDVVLMVTDGYTPWPETPLRQKVKVVVCLTDSGTRSDIPSWIEVVDISDMRR